MSVSVFSIWSNCCCSRKFAISVPCVPIITIYLLKTYHCMCDVCFCACVPSQSHISLHVQNVFDWQPEPVLFLIWTIFPRNPVLVIGHFSISFAAARPLSLSLFFRHTAHTPVFCVQHIHFNYSFTGPACVIDNNNDCTVDHQLYLPFTCIETILISIIIIFIVFSAIKFVFLCSAKRLRSIYGIRVRLPVFVMALHG